MTMNARHKRAGTWTMFYFQVMRDCAIRILHRNRSSDHDCSWTFGYHFLHSSVMSTPLPSRHPWPLWKAIDSMPMRNVFSLSLLKIGWRRHAVGRACWLVGQGPPQDCLACGMKLVRRWVTILVADSREHTGNLSCSLEPPLQPGILNSCVLCEWGSLHSAHRHHFVWQVSQVSLSSESAPEGEETRRSLHGPGLLSSLPDRRARLWKFWRKPFLNRWGMLDCWGLGGGEGSLAWIWIPDLKFPTTFKKSSLTVTIKSALLICRFHNGFRSLFEGVNLTHK